MKTRTFARLALLIPLLIWLILFLVELLINVVIPADLRPSGPTSLLGVLEIALFFYVVGILFWFIPYLVLSIALLVMSFKIRLELLKVVFVLSPFAMTILVMLEVTIIWLASGGDAIPSVDLVSTFKNTMGVNLLFGIVTLACGYLCVGIGYGLYKLFHRLAWIDDEEKINPELVSVNSLNP